jgi:squalene cyclase
MPLKFNPLPALTSTQDIAIKYFTQRDLLYQTVEPISTLWQLPQVQKIFQKQQPDGSWKPSGKPTVTYPTNHGSLVETWKNLRILFEHYELNQTHEGARKAAEYLLSCQTSQGDIRGMIANQYATYYTGAMLALLIKMGYGEDSRVQRGLDWLLSMRQTDGGWTIPILTHKFDKQTFYNLTSKYAEPVEPDMSKPFSHNWTDMVLRAFAVHPKYRSVPDIRKAADLLKSSFFRPDYYTSYQDADYWVRFLFWWPNLITALDTLSLMGYSKDDPDIAAGLSWLVQNQLPNGLWKLLC